LTKGDDFATKTEKKVIFTLDNFIHSSNESGKANAASFELIAITKSCSFSITHTHLHLQIHTHAHTYTLLQTHTSTDTQTHMCVTCTLFLTTDSIAYGLQDDDFPVLGGPTSKAVVTVVVVVVVVVVYYC